MNNLLLILPVELNSDFTVHEMCTSPLTSDSVSHDLRISRPWLQSVFISMAQIFKGFDLRMTLLQCKLSIYLHDTRYFSISALFIQLKKKLTLAIFSYLPCCWLSDTWCWKCSLCTFGLRDRCLILHGCSSYFCPNSFVSWSASDRQLSWPWLTLFVLALTSLSTWAPRLGAICPDPAFHLSVCQALCWIFELLSICGDTPSAQLQLVCSNC